MKKVKALSIILSISLLLAGCANSKTETKEDSSKDTNVQIATQVNETKENTTKEATSEETNEVTKNEAEISNEEVTKSTSEEPSYYTGIGFIKKIENNSLIIDEVEFFNNSEEAVQEAIKDNKAAVGEDGVAFLPNMYYIRNNYDTLSEYSLDENCKYYLCIHVAQEVVDEELPLGTEGYLTHDLYEVSEDEFIKGMEYHGRLLTWFDVENGKVTEVYQQFLP